MHLITFFEPTFSPFLRLSKMVVDPRPFLKIVKLFKMDRVLDTFNWTFLFRAGKKSSCPNSCFFGEIRTQTLILRSQRHFLDGISNDFKKYAKLDLIFKVLDGRRPTMVPKNHREASTHERHV